MNDIRAMGVDPASVTGWAILHGDLPIEQGEWKVGTAGWSKTPAASSRAAKQLYNQVFAALVSRSTTCDVVVCEDPTSPSKGVSKAYGTLLGSVQLACNDAGVPCVFVRPTTWKKHVLGKGNADKQASIEFARGLLGSAPETDNVADALCLASYGVNVDHGSSEIETETTNKE